MDRLIVSVPLKYKYTRILVVGRVILRDDRATSPARMSSTKRSSFASSSYP
jgi:hypothetical protein